MRRRTRARELALQFLYTLEMRGAEARADLPTFLKEAKASVEVRGYTEELVDGVTQNKPALDTHLQEFARNWKFERIALVDRNVLRLASYEILYRDDVPARVALNEGIELGKRYSTAQSGGFINGILDRVLRLRMERDAKKDTEKNTEKDDPQS